MSTATVRTPLVLVLALLVFGVLGATSSAFACVVGTGTSASCTEVALDACLPGGGSFNGTVTFACGGAATITVTSTKGFNGANTTIDGGGVITISGGNMSGVFAVNKGRALALANVTIAGGTPSAIENNGGTLTNLGSVRRALRCANSFCHPLQRGFERSAGRHPCACSAQTSLRMSAIHAQEPPGSPLASDR